MISDLWSFIKSFTGTVKVEEVKTGFVSVSSVVIKEKLNYT